MAITNIPKKQWDRLERSALKKIKREAKDNYFDKYIKALEKYYGLRAR